MIKITDKSSCCGCSACFAVCPHDAIVMKGDSMGFRYPEVDMSVCVDCGLCEKVCAFRQSGTGRPLQAYAVRHKDLSEVEKSTSGAVFPVFAGRIIAQGGVVYGAAFDEKFEVNHKGEETLSGCEEFRRSKYVQSQMNDVFRRVRENLSEGRKVLFTGTPCQVAGLKSYVGERLGRNLYLMDIVCHGVPSPEVWKEYLKWQESRAGSRAVEVNFRDKTFGWRSHKESFVFRDRKVVSSSYTYLFYKHLTLRESCAVCPYANLSRPSDITIADYWRKDKTCPDFACDNKGCSLVLCNTSKGKELFEEISGSLHVVVTDISGCMQPNMLAPSRLSSDHRAFAEDFSRHGIGYVMKRYGDLGWRYKVEKSYKAVYQFIRQTARKILGRR